MRDEDLRSVIQTDFDDRLNYDGYAIHHVFPGPYRKNCEKYGFLVLIPSWQHEQVHQSINSGISLTWKRQAQRWYEEHVADRTNFIFEFGRSYL